MRTRMTLQEGDRRPIPDPTALTTEQLLREVNALKELLTMRMDGMENAVRLRFSERDLRFIQAANDSKDALAMAREAATSAISKQEEAFNKRFDIADAARAMLDERIRLMMPRSESEARHKGHEDHYAMLSKQFEGREERGKGMSSTWGLLIGAAGLIALIVGYFTK